MFKIEKTERGFEIVHFKDLNKRSCSLQQSSLAHYVEPGTSAIWFGVENERMHIGLEQLEELVELLANWVCSGSFDPEKRIKASESDYE